MNAFDWFEWIIIDPNHLIVFLVQRQMNSMRNFLLVIFSRLLVASLLWISHALRSCFISSIAINVNASRTSSANENIFIRLVVGSEWKCVYFVRIGCFVFVLVTIFKMDDVWHLYFSHIFSRNSLSRWNVWAIQIKVDFLSFFLLKFFMAFWW